MSKPENDKGPKHLEHIEALRGYAILWVLLFHFWPSSFPGGFVGVDVFFVISGYLITRQIDTQIVAGRFSLSDFLRKRIRRIVPAMLFLVAVTVASAFWIMLPTDAGEVAKSGFYSLLSAANVYFWREAPSDYFAKSSAELPLLHLWSLGLEEQFYLVWPLVLLTLRKRLPTRMLVALSISLAIGSFVYGQLLLTTDVKFAYYMLPARAGELLVGAIGSWLVVSEKLSPRIRDVISLLSLSLLCASLFFLSDSSPFPGLAALIPTMPSLSFVLFGGQGTRVGAHIANQTSIWLGARSYSLYLWHWPLLAFWRYGHGEPSPPASLALLALTIAAAVASHRLIEEPLRRLDWSFPKVFVRLLCMPALLISGMCFAVIVDAKYEIFQKRRAY
jgi:peptidoglycan/LPS O-acetylase OafA/YrhL